MSFTGNGTIQLNKILYDLFIDKSLIGKQKFVTNENS